MNLDERTHNFLVYMSLKNYWDSDRLTIKDLKWMVEYLEDRLDYYCEKIPNKELDPAEMGLFP